jgi:hypothetical protein
LTTALLFIKMRFISLLLFGLGASSVAAQGEVRRQGGAKFVELDQRDIAASVLESLLSALKNAAGCSGCEAALTVLKGVAALGDGFFVSTVSEVCVLSKVSTLYVSAIQ